MKEKVLRILESEDIDALKITLAEATKLDLTASNIIDTQALLLAEALKSNNTLTQLNLQYNRIGAEGAKAIGKALKTNSTLNSLNLQHNQIGDEGAKAIGKALKTNSTLTKLYLLVNQIGDEGAKAVGESLKINSALTKLYLYDNQIGDEGAKAIGEGLKINSTLTQLYLQHNQIGDEGAKAFTEALKINFTLTQLYLHSKQIGERAVIAEALARNKKLVEYMAKLAKLQGSLLKAIQSDDIEVGIRKLLHQYQDLISQNPVPNSVQVKDKEIGTYISKNYFTLIGVCKNVGNDQNQNAQSGLWLKLPIDIMVGVLSYLWPHSLSPQLFPKIEEKALEPHHEIDTLGNIHTDSA